MVAIPLKLIQNKQQNKLKMKLLDLANITLLWEDSPRIGLMEFIKPPSEIFCQVNPYNNQGRNKFKDKLKTILEDYLETEYF